jgi:hypothetical protein
MFGNLCRRPFCSGIALWSSIFGAADNHIDPVCFEQCVLLASRSVFGRDFMVADNACRVSPDIGVTAENQKRKTNPIKVSSIAAFLIMPLQGIPTTGIHEPRAMPWAELHCTFGASAGWPERPKYYSPAHRAGSDCVFR